MFEHVEESAVIGDFTSYSGAGSVSGTNGKSMDYLSNHKLWMSEWPRTHPCIAALTKWQIYIHISNFRAD